MSLSCGQTFSRLNRPLLITTGRCPAPSGGADGGSRTPTVAHWILNPARLPVPPHPHMIQWLIMFCSGFSNYFVGLHPQKTSKPNISFNSSRFCKISGFSRIFRPFSFLRGVVRFLSGGFRNRLFLLRNNS